jgi:small GTP-binding protein
VQDKYPESYVSTIGVDWMFKKMTVQENKQVKLQVWDTAGQERYRSITGAYYRDADAIIIVYDVSSKRSFEHVRDWANDVATHADQPLVFLAGNKVDVPSNERQVSTSEGKGLAEDLNMVHFETSSKADDDNLQVMFKQIADSILKLRANHEDAAVNHAARELSLHEDMGISKVQCCSIL